MKEYFELQMKMTNRRFKEIGITPFFAYIILTAIFIGLSIYLFNKTENAKYFYPLIPIIFLTKLSESNRTEFLKITFSKHIFFKIRIAENILLTIPFVLFLLYKGFYFYGLAPIIPAFLMVFTNINADFSLTIPTPFSKKPFEYAVGFRKTFYLLPIAYILTIIAISVNNFNLGIFSLMSVYLLCISFYFKPETEIFVWYFNKKPSHFLYEKIKTSFIYSSLLTAPVIISLGIAYPNEILYIILFILIGLAFLTFTIVAKYAAYPDEIGIIQGFLFALALFFPPILVVLIPVLYNQSVKRLKYLLG